jgi:phospholipid/cholesterol/gamma-HCH transport system substrate-binding protein
METRANHVWVGAVTLVLLAALAAFIVWIARLGDAGKREYDIFFKQSVDGLSKGSSVTFSGVPVGQVEAIELWTRDPGFVRVRIAVDSGVPVLIGTTATMQGSFTGVSNVQLEGATKGAKPIACDDQDLKASCPEGVPVIPTKRGGLGELLNSAPVLLERLATLTERLTLVFDDQNQESIRKILANADRLTGHLADASPRLDSTLVQLESTLAEAKLALTSFEKTATTANGLLDSEGRQTLSQFNRSMKSLEKASHELEALLGDTRPAVRQLSEGTLPEAEAAMRDLRSATRALRDMTEKLNDQGAGALVGGQKLPDYKP